MQKTVVNMTEHNLHDKLDKLQQKADERSSSKELKLPICPDTKRGTPNSFLRSALFSAIQSKDRVFLKDVILASQSGITVTFTGEQLNQEDLTLWETLVHLAKDEPLGVMCRFTAYDILKSMGLGDSIEVYNRLLAGIYRLNACSVRITHDKKTFFGSLIDGGAKDEITNDYIVQLNRQLIRLYSQSTWIDWDQRLLLRKKPLAQTLHGYYSSHKNPYPVKIETLQQLSGSKNKRVSGFKQKLVAAFDELIKIDFLESYHIDDKNIATVKRKNYRL